MKKQDTQDSSASLMLHGRASIPNALRWGRAHTARPAASRRRIGRPQKTLLTAFVTTSHPNPTASSNATVNGRIRSAAAIRRFQHQRQQ